MNKITNKLKMCEYCGQPVSQGEYAQHASTCLQQFRGNAS